MQVKLEEIKALHTTQKEARNAYDTRNKADVKEGEEKKALLVVARKAAKAASEAPPAITC